MAKVLITGAKGQLGTDLVIEAKKRGHEVYGFSSKELDITDKALVDETIYRVRPNVVINAAAYTAVDKAETEPDKAFSVNENGVKNLALICRELDIPIFHISTDYVFDGEKREPYVEIDIPNPTSVYGASKLAGEIALQETWKKHIILRVSWVFGEHGSNFVKTMLRLARERDEVSVVDDQYGAPTSSVAIAECLLDILSRDGFSGDRFPWGIYHYQSDPGVTWYEFAKEIFSLIESTNGKLVKTVRLIPVCSNQFPTQVVRPKNSKLNGDCIKLALEVNAANWKQDELLKIIENY